MRKPHIYDAQQYQAALDAIAIADGGAAGEMPKSLRGYAGKRGPALEASWPDMSLEDRISAVAVMIGFHVPGDASNPRHVVTYGYEMLCREGSLLAPESIAA